MVSQFRITVRLRGSPEPVKENWGGCNGSNLARLSFPAINRAPESSLALRDRRRHPRYSLSRSTRLCQHHLLRVGELGSSSLRKSQINNGLALALRGGSFQLPILAARIGTARHTYLCHIHKLPCKADRKPSLMNSVPSHASGDRGIVTGCGQNKDCPSKATAG